MRSALAIRLGGATIAFLLAYGALTVLHELGREPAFVGAIASIPLFARVVLCASIAPPAALLAGQLAGQRGRVLRAMPAALAAAIGLTALAVLVFA